VNQTEQLLEHARDDIDRRLIEFGHDPWQVESFLRLTPAQRLNSLKKFNAFAKRGRASLARVQK
jgi:hypothetical protein